MSIFDYRAKPTDQKWLEHNRNLYEGGATPNEMLEANMGFVAGFAQRKATKMKRPDLYDDYFQAACMGFLKAFKTRDGVRVWDPDKGALSTFVSPNMIATMQKEVDTKSFFKIAIPQRVQYLEDFDEVMPSFVSLDQELRPSHGGESFERVDIIPDESTLHELETVDAELDLELLRSFLREAVPENLHELLDAFLADPEASHADLGRRVGMTPARGNLDMRLLLNVLRWQLGGEEALEFNTNQELKRWSGYVNRFLGYKRGSYRGPGMNQIEELENG